MSRKTVICGGNLDPWRPVKDGDYTAFRMFRRHYSCRNRTPKTRQILGPGEKLLLVGRYISKRSVTKNYVCGFRFSRYRNDRQEGVNLAVFRNGDDSCFEASYLLKWAEAHAFKKWGAVRMFTFVKPAAVRSVNPGYCFKQAGWRRCGATAKGLLIFEKTTEDTGLVPGWHPWESMRST